MGLLLFALVCAVTPFSADATGVAQSTGLEEARMPSVEVKANFVPQRRACPKGLGTRGAVHHAAVPTVRFSALWAGWAGTLKHLCGPQRRVHLVPAGVGVFSHIAPEG